MLKHVILVSHMVLDLGGLYPGMEFVSKTNIC